MSLLWINRLRLLKIRKGISKILSLFRKNGLMFLLRSLLFLYWFRLVLLLVREYKNKKCVWKIENFFFFFFNIFIVSKKKKKKYKNKIENIYYLFLLKKKKKKNVLELLFVLWRIIKRPNCIQKIRPCFRKISHFQANIINRLMSNNRQSSPTRRSSSNTM